MALVDEEQVILGKIVEKVGRRRPFRLAGEMAAVILDAVAIAEFLDHLQIEHGPLLQPLGLDQPVFPMKTSRAAPSVPP